MGIIGVLNAILRATAIHFEYYDLAVAFIISGNIYIAADRVIGALKGGE